MASRDLIFRFMGVDAGAGAQFDRMGRKAATTGETLSKFAKGAAIAGAIVAAEGIKMAMHFQAQMELIHTQAGATQAEVTRMSKSVLQLAGPTATAPEELAKGLYHLESTGLRGAKALDALKIAAEGAKLGGADLEDTTNALNAVISSGIKGSSDLNAAMGMLNATVGSGDMRMQDLANAMGTGLLVQARNFGVSLNEVGAALAVFGDNNIRGADAATQLRMAMNFLSKGTATADDALAKVGITSEQLSNDLANGGLNKAITDLHDHFQAAGVTGSHVGQVIVSAFGKKAGSGIATLLTEFDRFQTKLHLVQADSNTFGQSWTAYTHTAQYNWDSFRASVTALVTEIGAKLIPAFTSFTKYLTQHVIPAVSSVIDFLGKHKNVIEPLAKTVLGLAAAWKVYVLWTKAAAAANIFLGRSAVTATGEELGLAAAARTAGGFGVLGAGAALTLAPAAGVGAMSDQHTSTPNGGTNSLMALLDEIAKAKGHQAAVTAQLSLNHTAGVGFSPSGGEYTGITPKVLADLRAKYLGVAAAAKTSAAATVAAGRANEGLGAKYRGVATGASNATVATRTNTGAQRSNAAAIQLTAKKLQGLDNTLAANASALLAASGSYDAFRQGLNDLRSQVKNNGRELAGYSDKAIANRDAIRQLGSGILQHVADMQKQGKSAQEVTSTLKRMEGSLLENAAKVYGNRDAVRALLQQWGLLPSQVNKALAGLDGAANTARSGGQKVGEALDAGVLAGMALQAQTIKDRAFAIGQGAAMSVKAGAQSHSPSKITIQVGKDIADGLIVGFNGRYKKVFDSMSKAVQGELTKLATDLSNAKAYKLQTKQSLVGYADITQAPQAGVSVSTFQRAKLNDLKRFAHDLSRLRSMGLSSELLSELAAAGPAAIPVAEQLLQAGRGGIRRADREQRLIDQYSGQAASTAAGAQYGGRLSDDIHALPAAIAKAIDNAHFTIYIDGKKASGRAVAHRRRTDH